MATLEQNIKQAIADFDDIEAAIEELGVDVPYGMDTKEYGNLIRQRLGLRITVDQNYDPESSNPQSGTAVAEALASQPIKYLESLDKDNYLNLYDLESGMYVLRGTFYVYPNATKRFVFSKMLFVAVSHGTISTCVQVIYPPYNTIQYLNIYPPDEEAGTGYTYERKDAELYYMEDVRQKVTKVDGNADDEHYPSAKAVYDAVNDNTLHGKASGEVIRVDDVSPIEHTVKAKVKSKNLIPLPYYQYKNGETEEERKGLTITIDNGVITLNGTCTEDMGIGLIKNGTIPVNGAYTLSGIKGGSPTSYYMQSYIDGVYQTIVTNDPVTYNWNGNLTQLSIYIKAGTVCENIKLYPMFELDDTATEYTPYVDPATVTVTRCGKNILPNVGTTMTGNGITFTVNADGSVTCNGTATKNAVINLTENYRLPLGTYILRGCPSTGSDTTYRLQTNKIINGEVSTGCVDVGSSARLNITQECQVYSYIVVLKDTTVSNITFYPQLLPEAETDTTYEPYNGTTYTPEADGIVSGIVSVAPTMTLLTDKAGVTIEAEYNQDINAAFDKINDVLETLLNGGA